MSTEDDKAIVGRGFTEFRREQALAKASFGQRGSGSRT